MHSRLIFLHRRQRLNRDSVSYPRQSPRLDVGVSQDRGRFVAEVCGGWAEKSCRGDDVVVRTKTDTGRRGEYPKALERTAVKELGKITP